MRDFSELNAKVHGGNSLCVRWEGRFTGSSVFNQSVSIFLDGLIKSGPQPSREPLLVLVTTSARLRRTQARVAQDITSATFYWSSDSPWPRFTEQETASASY